MCNQNQNHPVPRGAVCAENTCLLSSINYLLITMTGKSSTSTGRSQFRDLTDLECHVPFLDVLVDLFNFYSTRRAKVKPVYGLGVGFNLVNICAIFNLLNQQTANSFVTCINKKHKTILSRFYFHS